jgi:competence protein ComEC
MNFWSNNPAFKILTPMVLGIIYAVVNNISHHYFLFVSLFLLLVSAVFFYNKIYRLRYVKGFVFFGLLFCLSAELVAAKTELNQPNHFSKHLKGNSVLKVKLLENTLEKEKSYKAILEVSRVVNNAISSEVKGKLLAYFSKDSLSAKLKYGDVILLNTQIGEVSKPTNPQQFNYKYYLTLNNINHQAFIKAKNYKVVGKNKGSFLIKYGYQLRDKLYGYLEQNGVEGNQLKVASALLLGYREFLDKDLVKSYSSAGAMHVLAVSGLHVGIIFFLLKFSLGFLNKMRFGKYYFTLVILFCLWFYAMMTGFSPSVLRATTMFSFILVGEKLINRKVSIYNTLAVSAIILLVYNPFLVFEVGFQLSYLAVIGIVFIQPKIYKLIYVPNKLLDKAWNITAVSIAAQIATFPLGLYYFHQFPVYFFISNLVVIPSAIFIFYLGVCLFLTAPFGGVSLAIGKLLNGLIWCLNYTVKFTEELPFSLVSEISVGRLEAYLLYAIIVAFLVFIYKRSLKILYLTYSICFLFIGIQFYEKWNDIYRKDFTVYSVNKETVFEFSKGKKSYFVSDNSMWEDESKMLFNIKHNWYKKNISNTQFISLDSLRFEDELIYVNNGIISFEGMKVISLTASNIALVKIIEPNYIIVSKKNIKQLYKLNKEIATTFILDSSVPNYSLKHWKENFVNSEVFSSFNSFVYRVF